MTWKFTFGLPETGCGAGSKIASTKAVRGWLPVVFAKLGINRVVDAPCGDFNWMARTDLSGVDYVGYDFDPVHVFAARQRDSVPSSFRPKSKQIECLDILNKPLGKSDAIICRDFLQHLPNVDATRMIDRIQDSGAKYLLATSHTNLKNTNIARPGDFRPLNLTLHPFNLPWPLECVDDSGRLFGLWKLR